MRARSTQEVRQLLARRGYSPDETEAVIARLTSAKFLDDLDFARTWVRSRALRQAVAPGRLAQELRAKGIGEGEISAALVDLTAEPAVREIAREAAARKVRTLQGLDPAIARRRLAAHLSRRGFEADVILALCREYFPGTSDPDDEP
jgi:regulatory protein